MAWDLWLWGASQHLLYVWGSTSFHTGGHPMVPTGGNRRDGAMRCNKDHNVLKTLILESATQQLIPHEAGHALEIQIVKNQYVMNAEFACCVLSHVPFRWPDYGPRLEAGHDHSIGEIVRRDGGL
jgi:hypothetical protein